MPIKSLARGCALLLLLLLASAAAADPLVVQFDCGTTLACRDVTPEGFADTLPGQKLVEVVVRVSPRVVSGDSADLERLHFEIFSPERRPRVHDFQPVTQLQSDQAEPIVITETTEKKRSLGVTLGGSVAVPTYGVDVKAAPSANAGAAKKHIVTETRKQIPPKKAIVISGTTRNEHGVFFKFIQSPYSSLEGVRPLTLQLTVPESWRGDWLLVSCRAVGLRKQYWRSSNGPCGSARFAVGLYLEGDPEAKSAAEKLAAASEQSREKVQESREGEEGRSDRVVALRLACAELRKLAGPGTETE